MHVDLIPFVISNTCLTSFKMLPVRFKKTASGSLNKIDSLAKFDGGEDVFRPQVFNSLWQMETFKSYFIKPNVLYAAYTKYKTLGEFALCEWASKGQLTSVRASAGRRVIVRVRLPLPTRPGRGAGKGTLDQLAELGSPVWKSGQLMPVNQIKGHKYREEGDETYMYFWLNVNVWVAVGTESFTYPQQILWRSI